VAKETINPSNVHPTKGYSHAIKAGNTIYCAGQVGIGEDGKVVEGFEEQAGQALENLKRILEAAGATLNDVVKTITYVKTMEYMSGYREARQKYFGDHRPAATLIQVAGLARPELLIEIEAIAVVG
jgi:2-iminobutanoate/2-iminopropanoate deaminase